MITFPRFFVPTERIDGDIRLDGADAAHVRALRLRAGDRVTVCAGDGADHVCVITDISPHSVTLLREHTTPSPGELSATISVLCAFPKSDKAEHIVQKATELGASTVAFFPSEFAVAKSKNTERLQRVAKEAAQQAQRGKIPNVLTFDSFAAMLEYAAADTALFCYERETTLTLSAALQLSTLPSQLSIITGAEGGFSEREAAMAREAGCKVITLGTCILRCETAPLAVLSALMLSYL